MILHLFKLGAKGRKIKLLCGDKCLNDGTTPSTNNTERATCKKCLEVASKTNYPLITGR
jgi:hypothetical protein